MAKASPANTDSFAKVFKALKAILAAHVDELVIAADKADHYCLNTTKDCRKRPMNFGEVKIGKNYVSYHLMPVYCCPELVKSMSPELGKRMQGKACFNFREVDAALFAELAKVTKIGLKRFKQGGWA
jgi:hypothetical protein